jgi:hypothetical protein
LKSPQKRKKREEVWILFSISRAEEENRNFEIAPKTKQTQKKEEKKEAKG